MMMLLGPQTHLETLTHKTADAGHSDYQGHTPSHYASDKADNEFDINLKALLDSCLKHD